MALAACSRDAAPRSEPVTVGRAMRRSPMEDSLRARRSAKLATRPDTFGARVDLSRIAGPATAPVWIVVVSDFQCAPCREFATTLLLAIRRDYVDRGSARLAFVNFPQDQHFNARFAAHAALCAGASGHFWAMHDSLFVTQAHWARSDDPRPFMDDMAISIGANASEQRSCTERNRLFNLMAGDRDRSLTSGVTELPTVLIGEEKLAGATLT